jgi:hypothetical protein
MMLDELSTPDFIIDLIDPSDFEDGDFAPFLIDVIDLSDFDNDDGDLFDFNINSDPVDAFFDEVLND